MFFNLYYAIVFPIIFSQLDFIENFFLSPIDVAKNITLEYYTGKWYQAATSRSTQYLGTGPNYTDVTADYYCIDDCSNNNISVYNQGFDNEGLYTNISGYSYVDDGEESARRKLKFYSLPFEGNYWIVKLGPVIDEEYQYSIVSGPISKYFGTRFSLYVLSRNITHYLENYEEEVKTWCVDNGFKYNWNEYVPTY